MGGGAVFALNTDGTGFRIVNAFTAVDPITRTNWDGASPGRLLLSGKTLYGEANVGGISRSGTLFSVNTDGTGFTVFFNYQAGLSILSGDTLYATANDSVSGAIVSIGLPPQLTIIPSAPNIVLTWPTNFTGFTLQSTTNLASPIWTTNLPAPVMVNGQYTVTNSISGAQQFFRLSQ